MTHALLATLALVFVLALPSTAAAQNELPPGSGVDQYVESLPGAGGDQVPGTGGRARSGFDGALSPATKAQLARDPEGKLAQRIATDPSFGAPGSAASRRIRGGNGSTLRGPADGKTSSSTGVPATVSRTFLDPRSGLPVLICAVLIAAAGIAAAYRRGVRRGSRTATQGS